MKIRMEFVPGPVPEEREAVEMEAFPLVKHGCTMELEARYGPNGWPVITIEGPDIVVADLLKRGGIDLGSVEVLH